MEELKPCPFCEGSNITIHASSISPDCYIICGDCGASIERDVSWGDMDEPGHDRACAAALVEAWNRRSGHGTD